MMRLRSIWTRLLSLSVVVALIVPVLVVPASAASWEGTISSTFFSRWESASYYGGQSFSFSVPRAGQLSDDLLTWTTYDLPPTGPQSIYIYPNYFRVSGSFTGTFSIYLSLFLVSSYYDTFLVDNDNWSDPSLWRTEYTDANGSFVYGSVDLDTFEPNSGYYPTQGISLSARVVLDNELSLSGFELAFLGGSSKAVSCYMPYIDGIVAVRIPSCTVVSTETSEQLEELEAMADQIAQQNQLLQAMYGDIISLLQSIYTNTGDMEAALNLANQYLASMSTYLQGILSKTDSIYQIMSTYMHYLQDISETADDIYAEFQSFHSDFLSKMSELVGVIQDESDDIQAKMEDIYQRLITWLNSQFSSAANPGLSGNSQTVSGNIQQSNTISSQYTGSMTSQFGSLNLGSFSFATNMVTALTFVSTLWTSFYDNAGDYKIIILLPMYIGICLLVVGMARKLANRGGGGKE